MASLFVVHDALSIQIFIKQHNFTRWIPRGQWLGLYQKIPFFQRIQKNSWKENIKKSTRGQYQIANTPEPRLMVNVTKVPTESVPLSFGDRNDQKYRVTPRRNVASLCVASRPFTTTGRNSWRRVSLCGKRRPFLFLLSATRADLQRQMNQRA